MLKLEREAADLKNKQESQAAIDKLKMEQEVAQKERLVKEAAEKLKLEKELQDLKLKQGADAVAAIAAAEKAKKDFEAAEKARREE